MMLIYTSNADGKKLDHVRRLGMGILISGSSCKINSAWKGVPVAIDNGAYQYWRRGFPFMEGPFLATITKAFENGLSLQFIVCPDIVAGGRRSLEFSCRWARGKLETAPSLALAVQDGMSPCDVKSTGMLGRFSHIFVGGTKRWKWETAGEWISFARDNGLKSHIGRCGTLDGLEMADHLGADSVDSSSFARNDSWEIVERFRGGKQLNMLEGSPPCTE